MGLKTVWNSLMDEVESYSRLKKAELDLGVTAVEAAAFDKARTDLALVVGSINVDYYLQGAVELAKCGVTPEEVYDMVKQANRASVLKLDENERYLRLIKQEEEA